MAITVKLSAQSVSCGFAVCNKIVASAPANFMLYLEKLARRPENTSTFSLENARNKGKFLIIHTRENNKAFQRNL